MRVSIDTKRALWFDARDKLISLCSAFAYDDRAASLWNHVNGEWQKDLFEKSSVFVQAKWKLLVRFNEDPSLAPPRTQSFIALLSYACNSNTFLKRAAELGDGLACAVLVVSEYRKGRLDAALEYARLAASKGERDGMYYVYKIERKKGIKPDVGVLQRAAELGHKKACEKYLLQLPTNSIDRLMLTAHFLDWDSSFKIRIQMAIKLGCDQDSATPITFHIGQASNYRTNRRALLQPWKENMDDNKLKEALETARQFYTYWSGHYRNAVYAWLIIAKRLGICKDICVHIGKIVWNYRYDAETAPTAPPQKKAKVIGS